MVIPLDNRDEQESVYSSFSELFGHQAKKTDPTDNNVSLADVYDAPLCPEWEIQAIVIGVTIVAMDVCGAMSYDIYQHSKAVKNPKRTNW